MEKLAIIIITLSNIFGIIPLYQLALVERYYGIVIVSIAILASILMNLTSTINNFPVIVSLKYSKVFKYVDGITAKIAALYGFYLFHTNPIKNATQVILPIIGLITLYGSDRVKNLKLYTLTQIIWHALAYISIFLNIH